MLSLSVASSSTVAFTPKTFSPSNIHKSSFNGVQITHISPSPFVRTTTGHSAALSVVMMAKREEELQEIRAKTTEEINEEIIDLKGELFVLRLQKKANSEFKSSEFRRMRKRIARMFTVKREREIEEGIGKRKSRKLDKEWRRNLVPRPPLSLLKMQEEAEVEAK